MKKIFEEVLNNLKNDGLLNRVNRAIKYVNGEYQLNLGIFTDRDQTSGIRLDVVLEDTMTVSIREYVWTHKNDSGKTVGYNELTLNNRLINIDYDDYYTVAEKISDAIVYDLGYIAFFR